MKRIHSWCVSLSMSSNTVHTWPTAWEPLTPRGVATFARATLGRLWLVQLLVAILAGASVVWFLHHAWFPVVREAIQQLPAEGEIRNQQLQSPAGLPMQLAENRFLGIAIDLEHGGQISRESQLQVEFGLEDVRIFGLLGYTAIKYKPGWKVAFNRKDLEPWWGAWEPAILVGAGLATIVGLLVSWTLLATLYFVPVRVVGFFQNRDLKLWQSWKLAGAALMPGALFLTFAIVGYSLSWVDLIRLSVLFGIHFLVGLVYLWISPMFLPRIAVVSATRPNPFLDEQNPEKDGVQTNPFSKSDGLKK
ncbi:MAG: hypothetical protein JWQ71_4363 [Pedosphaera sp.]|nr:hypothetical protein [Pedosphaera sp.]